MPQGINCNGLIRNASASLDPGFESRLTFVRTEIARRRGQVKVEHKQIAALVAEQGGDDLGESSWSQIFGLKQPMSIRTALALCQLAGVRVGWFLAKEGEAPLGYTEPVDAESAEPRGMAHEKRVQRTLPLSRGAKLRKRRSS